MKRKEAGVILSRKFLTPEICDMEIRLSMAAEAHAGQFVGIYTGDPSRILPRPISICEITGPDSLRVVFRLAGEGTREIAAMEPGATVQVLGILGNGYDIDVIKGKRVFLFGGGIGIPPMLELAKELSAAGGTEIQIILGYRDSAMFLKEDLEKYGRVSIATEDSSFGTGGNVMDAIRAEGLSADLLCACGPMPMLRALKKYALEQDMPAYLSLEERMACGVGACLGCVCTTKEVDAHSHVHNARICTDGPVFEARTVEI